MQLAIVAGSRRLKAVRVVVLGGATGISWNKLQQWKCIKCCRVPPTVAEAWLLVCIRRLGTFDPDGIPLPRCSSANSVVSQTARDHKFNRPVPALTYQTTASSAI